MPPVRWVLLILILTLFLIGCSSSDKKRSLSEREQKVKDRRASYGLETPHPDITDAY